MQILKKFLMLLLTGLAFTTFADQNSGITFEADLHLKKQGFSLGYSYKYRQAVWVAYTLTAEHLTAEQVRRKDNFRVDSAVTRHPVRPQDYVRSGYDKGHLAPAADMTYSETSMNNSFLMTNISPQIPGCNRGIWKRLESQVRRWTLKEEELYIITGPIFPRTPNRMKKSKIPIPSAFYKVILDLTPPMKMIGFIIPNATSKRKLSAFAVSVDEVERLTGYDFFSDLDDDIENSLEKTSNWQNRMKQ